MTKRKPTFRDALYHVNSALSSIDDNLSDLNDAAYAELQRLDEEVERLYDFLQITTVLKAADEVVALRARSVWRRIGTHRALQEANVCLASLKKSSQNVRLMSISLYDTQSSLKKLCANTEELSGQAFSQIWTSLDPVYASEMLNVLDRACNDLRFQAFGTG